MKTATRVGSCTFEDFCVVVHEDDKADLLHGIIYMASPENLDSHKLFQWLYSLLVDFVELKGSGEIFGSRVAFRLSDANAPEPDIAFVRADRLHLARKNHFEGPPDLVMEIVSPERVERDYEVKRLLYEAKGIREYWIIDEEEKKVTLLCLDRTGKFKEVRPRKGELHSRVLPDFWLRLEWLWPATRPKKADVLRQLLA
jgi:Uma2 family endonuclease